MPINLPDIDIDAITTLEAAKQAIRELLNSFETVLKRLDSQEKENLLLKREIAVLRKQSGKPYFKNPQQSPYSSTTLLKEEGSKWQKGSKKGQLSIDTHVNSSDTTVCECGESTFRTLRTKTRIVQGILIRRNNTAHHLKEKQCVSCGKIYKGELPAGIKGLSFDQDLQTLTSFLKFNCRLTHPLLHSFLRGFGVNISYGQITEILKRNSQKLIPPYTHLRTRGFKSSSYLASDATGEKRKQQYLGDSASTILNQHLHIVGNSLLSVFKVTGHYNAEVLNHLLGRSGRRKLYLSDDGSPNGEKLKVKRKQLCWVHEIRHYLKLSPHFKIHTVKLEDTLERWREFYHLAKGYGRDPTPEVGKQLREMFGTITKQTTGYEKLDHQLRLTGKKRDRLLTFLRYPFLPIHNNQSERDLREFVIQRKISGETKSVAGDRSIERHLSVIQTARKQGLDVYKTLHGLLTNQLSPSILTLKVA